jgi:anti-sigma regulatory factor (Ser/Thr protein kinase)
MHGEIVLALPNVLGRSPRNLETFLPSVWSSREPSDQSIALDLRDVRWVCPYGALLLVQVCALLAQSTGHAVRITGMQPDIHAYLRRIDFFLAAGDSAFTEDPCEGENLSRRPASTNVLELTHIGGSGDIAQAMDHARRILAYWLSASDDHIGRVMTLISESCSNIVQHSGATGWIVIQKYDRTSQGLVAVELAIGDLGKGIRASLREVHGEVASETSEYIGRALSGMSARGVGAVGQGLGAMRDTAVGSGGHLFIHSGNGRLWVNGTGIDADDDSVVLPGTQLALRFCSRM